MALRSAPGAPCQSTSLGPAILTFLQRQRQAAVILRDLGCQLLVRRHEPLWRDTKVTMPVTVANGLVSISCALMSAGRWSSDGVWNEKRNNTTTRVSSFTPTAGHMRSTAREKSRLPHPTPLTSSTWETCLQLVAGRRQGALSASGDVSCLQTSRRLPTPNCPDHGV